MNLQIMNTNRDIACSYPDELSHRQSCNFLRVLVCIVPVKRVPVKAFL